MIVDTNCLIAAFQGDVAAQDAIAQPGTVVPDVVVAEFLTGFATDGRRDRMLARLEADVDIGYPNRRWIECAARLRQRLRKAGSLVRVPDLWIAAWAEYHQCAVLTRNVGDFEKLGVATQNW